MNKNGGRQIINYHVIYMTPPTVALKNRAMEWKRKLSEKCGKRMDNGKCRKLARNAQNPHIVSRIGSIGWNSFVKLPQKIGNLVKLPENKITHQSFFRLDERSICTVHFVIKTTSVTEVVTVTVTSPQRS